MKPWLHAKSAARHWGGKPADYLAIEDYLDISKMSMPDMRHRAILHNSLGCYLAEMQFGHNITNSDGKEVSVRDIAERHILEDLGFIPTVYHYLQALPMFDWLGGRRKKNIQEESNVNAD